MKVVAFLAVTLAAASLASIVPSKEDRVQADEKFLVNQERVLDLFVGLGHSDHFKHEHEHFDILGNVEHWTNPEVPKKFYAEYKRGFLPKDAIYTLECPHVRHTTILLFDLFYFAKDFETLYSVACWAKLHINPVQFYFTFTSALMHHEHGRKYHVPPFYEIFPTFFVPQDSMHSAYDEKMAGAVEAHFHINSTGWESSYHQRFFGGLFGYDNYSPHLENKASYFREDIALNDNFLDFVMINGVMMPKEKYNSTFNRWGEITYFKNQQLLARYALERIALGMPVVEPLSWGKPIKAGYNPRIAHFNGEAFLTRPDNFMPEKSANVWMIKKSQQLERRIRDSIDFGRLLPEEHGSNKDGVNLRNKDGVNWLGYALSGGYRRHFYGNFYWNTLDALSNLVKTRDDRSFRGGVLNIPPAMIRDPLFFSFLSRFIQLFDSNKRTLHPYTRPDILFPGVTVKSFEVDKLVTYIEKFDFEITNGLAVKEPNDYINLKFHASQHRLNHKPYNFKINVNSEKEVNAIVTIFVGPEFDPEMKKIPLEQKRLMYVALDRFVVKLNAGENSIERSSKEAVFAYSDKPSFRGLYNRIESAKKGAEQFFKNDGHCGFPEHLQLPIGSIAGSKFSFAVVITPAPENVEQVPKGSFCWYPRIHDDKAMGFPFDRPIYDEGVFDAPNVHFEQFPIYYRFEKDINRPEKN